MSSADTTPLSQQGPAIPPPPLQSPVPAKQQEAPQESDDDGTPMSLLGHLDELRRRLMWAVIAIFIGFLVCYQFKELLFNFVMHPLLNALPEGVQLQYLSPPEAFFVYMKMAFLGGLLLTSPYVFYQVWSFIAPGLYDEERKYIVPLAIISGIFFVGGAAFCYFQVFPLAFDFFLGFTSDNIKAAFTMTDSFGFCTKLLLAFGLVFEMPLFAFALTRLGLLTAAPMRRFRKYAVLIMFIFAAILTPPDVVSQFLMAIPMIILYEISIYITIIFAKKKPKAKETEKTEDTQNAPE